MLAKVLYAAYARLYAFGCWRRHHLTPAGMMMVAFVCISAMLGFNVFKTTIYQILALGVAFMAVSLGLSLFPFRFKVTVSRSLPEYASLDQRLFYDIDITNLTAKTCKGLILYEQIQDPRPSFETLMAKPEPFEHLRNAWDRKTLYYRWQWLIQKTAKARFSGVALPDLPPGQTVRVRSQMVPHFRGYLHFSGMILARPDVLGLFCRVLTLKKAQSLIVLPRQYRLEAPQLLSPRQYHAGGISLASAIGDSDEFMALRPYRPGDPIRNVHWRTFARTRELVIKEFEQEYFVRQALIVDTASGSSSELLFESAVSIAASYICSLQARESILDLMFVGNRLYSFSSGRGLAQREKMLGIMACVESCTDKTILELVPALRSGINNISSAICIFLDWQDDHKKIIQVFKEARVPVFIVVVTDDKLKMEEKIFQDGIPPAHIRVVEKDQIQERLGTS